MAISAYLPAILDDLKVIADGFVLLQAPSVLLENIDDVHALKQALQPCIMALFQLDAVLGYQEEALIAKEHQL